MSLPPSVVETIIELRQETVSSTKVPFSFAINNNKLLLGRTDDYLTGAEKEIGVATVNDGLWHHVGFTMDDNAYVFYIDGAVDNSGSFATATGDCSVGTTNSNMQIGVRSRDGGQKDSNLFDGSICQVGIWSRALSASEVQGVMYKQYADLSSADQVSLVSWYGLDADYNDAHGSNNGTNNGSTLTASVYGGNAPSKPRIFDSAPDVVDNYGTLHSGTALSFDGTNDYVTFPFQESGSYTISAWFKLDVARTSIVVNWGDQATGERRSLLIWNGGSGGYHVYSSTYGSNIAGSTVLSTGVWYHASVTVDVSDGSAKIYLNGSLDGSGTNTINSFTGTTGEIGRQPSGEYFDGSISNVKIFNSALTLAQIQEMYLNPEQILPTGVASSNLKLWLPLQEGSGTTNYDGSGNNNDGTISGATWVKAETEIAQTALIRSNYTSSVFYPEGLTAGQDIQGVTLANTDENVLTLNGAEYVEVDNVLTQIGTDTIGTAEMWIRPLDSTPSAHLKVFSIDDTDANTSFALQLRTDGIFRAIVKNAGTNQWYINTDSAELSSGTWHHIVLSQDGTSPVLYIDGVVPAQTIPVTTDKTAWLNDLSGIDNVIIGASNVNSGGYANFFDGDVDDVRIYSDALSATEVLKNYNAGKSKH